MGRGWSISIPRESSPKFCRGLVLFDPVDHELSLVVKEGHYLSQDGQGSLERRDLKSVVWALRFFFGGDDASAKDLSEPLEQFSVVAGYSEPVGVAFAVAMVDVNAPAGRVVVPGNFFPFVYSCH